FLKLLPTRVSKRSIKPRVTAKISPSSCTRSARSINSRPSNQAQLVRLHQIRMGRNNANAESVSAAFGRRHRSLIKITAVAVPSARVQNADHWVFDSAVVGLAVIRFNADVIRIDIAKINMGADFQRFADEN